MYLTKSFATSSTICSTKEKKGFITNYTASNDGFSFDITDELVNSDYNKRTDNQKKTSDEEVKELTKDVLPAEEQIAEMIEKKEEIENIVFEIDNEEIPEDLDDFLSVVNI